ELFEKGQVCMIPSIRRLAAMVAEEGPVARVIRKKLEDTFTPSHLSVLCESHLHNVPRGAEMHFLVHVVSEAFEGKTVLQRHRLVNECLAQELREGVHALRIEAVPTSKWTGEAPEPSPKCLGGSKK
ncbi:hypothetical protein PFISCL1PPCAC_17244, partial [Pristionchus fissidentatus]